MTKTVAIDLDDVVFPLVEKWLWLWTEYSGQQLSKDDITGWEMGQFIDPEFQPEEFYNLLRKPDLYDNMALMNGAKEGIERIREIVGWENVYFLTAGFHEGKRTLLNENKIIDGWEDETQVVYMRDKHRFDADILIDDRWETCIEWINTGREAILFDQPWNRKQRSDLLGSIAIAQGETSEEKWLDVIKWVEVFVEMPFLRDEIESRRQGYEPTEEQWVQSGLRARADEIKDSLPDWAVKRMHLFTGEQPEGIEVNDSGGMQSNIGAAFHLIDPLATRVLAEVFAFGAKKYEPDNWRLIPVEDHINHGLNHAFQALAQLKGLPYDDSEDHLAHAMWRFHAAVAMREQGGVKE